MIRSVKGMHDLLPEDSTLWQFVEQKARDIFGVFDYREIRTPILEETELFARGVGEATDIVEKEMYAFEDRSGVHLALRPEGTAGVVRSYIQHKLHGKNPETRLFYLGSMYRHENPQADRFRQFYQIGAEAFGVAAPEMDAEVMSMLHLFLHEVGIKDVVLEMNCLGDSSDRPVYLKALLVYLTAHRQDLCEDCLRRMERAPLRVLDCKNQGCKAIARDAPKVVDHLGEESQQHFAGVQRSLDRLQVPYRVKPTIVRGLDYYTRTVFEAVAGEGRGQKAICGGGRYDALVEQMGGPATPAVGYALGVERLVKLCRAAQLTGYEKQPMVTLIPISAEQRADAESWAYTLRKNRIHCILDLSGRSLKAQMRRANKAQSAYAVVLGEQELAQQQVQLKPLAVEGEVETIALGALVDVLKDRCS